MDFQTRYQKLKAYLGPFRLKQDFETIKTVAAIDALADRADMLQRGCVPGNAIPGSSYHCPPGIEPEAMMQKAEYYLESLRNQLFPLSGCFAEPGCTFIDHSFIQKDGVLHVFYNRGYIGFDWSEKPHDAFGHAWTTDLIHWEYSQPALSVTPNLYYESFQIWAPAVLEHNGKYWMFYTGVNTAVAQSVCAAVSDDLYHWTKVDANPLYTPGGWCPWDISKWSNCRDNFVFRDDDGTFYLYFCTDRYTETGEAEPASGIIRSSDLMHWEEVGTFRMPNCLHAAESPFVIKRNHLYYFFYTSYGIGTCYAISDNPVCNWKEIGVLMGVEQTPLDPAWVPSCAEIFEFHGKWYISCCRRQPGWEQYLELFELTWESDGTVRVSPNHIDSAVIL